MKPCNCKTKSFLHLSTCDSLLKLEEKIPYEYVYREAIHNPGSLIFYISATDDGAYKAYKEFKDSLNDEDWIFDVREGTVFRVTLSNDTDVTFITDIEAQLLLELPNSNCIFMEMNEDNTPLAEELFPKTNKMFFVNEETKELA